MSLKAYQPLRYVNSGFTRCHASDIGKTWRRLDLGQDIEFDGVVRSLAVHPVDPFLVFAGADAGLCKSTDGGVNWRRIDSILNG